MKKTLKEELKQLAHSILSSQNNENLDDLKTKAGELYEKLAVLSYIKTRETPAETPGTNNTSPAAQEASLPSNEEAKPTETPIVKSAPVMDEKPAMPTDNLRNIAVHYDDLPQFEPAGHSPNTLPKKEEKQEVDENPFEKPIPQKKESVPSTVTEKSKTKNEVTPHKRSLNDSLNNGLKFGLNDRLAFINHLFDGDATDYNRVISQLNTFDNFLEAKTFIEEQIKPDYDWGSKTIYEERFYSALEKKMED